MRIKRGDHRPYAKIIGEITICNYSILHGTHCANDTLEQLRARMLDVHPVKPKSTSAKCPITKYNSYGGTC
jgi:hypothetical protein